MPIYDYKGLNRQGKKVKGNLEAENSKTVRQRLKKKGIYVTEVQNKVKKKSKSSSSSGGKVSVDDLALVTRQLATLLKANIPLVDALGIVSEQTDNPTLTTAFSDIKNQVNEGATLHRSLARYPKIFDRIYVSMCEAGEMSGTLDVILIRLSEFTESQSELRSKLKSAMTYPIIMFVFMGLILAGLFVYLIPSMKEMFEDSEAEIPRISEIVFNTSDFIITYWMLILVTVGVLIFMFIVWKKSPAGSVQWDATKLRIPVFGELIRMVAVARFSRTLATLLNGGVPMLSAMSIVRNVVDNEILASAIDEARDNISEGESIAGPLKKSGEFPPILIHMVNVGEKTGDLENMLIQVSDSYDFQVRNKIDGFTSILEPVMLILMGVVVAIIVVAVILPMFAMQEGL